MIHPLMMTSRFMPLPEASIYPLYLACPILPHCWSAPLVALWLGPSPWSRSPPAVDRASLLGPGSHLPPRFLMTGVNWGLFFLASSRVPRRAAWTLIMRYSCPGEPCRPGQSRPLGLHHGKAGGSSEGMAISIIPAAPGGFLVLNWEDRQGLVDSG